MYGWITITITSPSPHHHLTITSPSHHHHHNLHHHHVAITAPSHHHHHHHRTITSPHLTITTIISTSSRAAGAPAGPVPRLIRPIHPALAVRASVGIPRRRRNPRHKPVGERVSTINYTSAQFGVEDYLKIRHYYPLPYAHSRVAWLEGHCVL